MENLFLMIKELRKKTGLGLSDCKKALVESNGNLNQAIDYLRKSGLCLALNKATNQTKEGSIFSCIQDRTGILLELNAETDFVTRTNEFNSFGQEIVNFAGKNDIHDLDFLKDTFQKKRLALIAKVSENITIYRIKKIFGNNLISYVHMNKIGVLVASSDSFLSFEQKNFMKNIAMHIVATNPLCLTQEKIPQKIIDHEFFIQKALAQKTGKSSDVLKRIIKGRMKKFISNITLLGQNFVMDTKKNVKEYLKEKNFSISDFIRLEVGVI